MTPRTRSMVLDWLAQHDGDVEALARWMCDSVRLGSVRACRALVLEAQGEPA